MKSLRNLYKIGRGPSSSHTMGPEKAATYFKNAYPDADSYKAILYGSLSSTGKGHKTDEAIIDVFEEGKIEVVFGDVNTEKLPHENTMEFFAYKNGEEIGKSRIMSVGGGQISVEGKPELDEPEVYKENSFEEIAEYCMSHNIRISDYVEQNEGEEIWAYLHDVWKAMKNAVIAGLSTHGVLDGGLGVERKAQFLYNQSHIDESDITKENRLVCAYAFAVSEENASGGTIVTAPTCGACGVLPAVMKYSQERRGYTDEEIVNALATAGLIGNLIKTNASISGAECGCQAEIGSACSMTSAALAQLQGLSLGQIEYAAEVAMEHHLGLTCDPISGLVQIPCIERNAVAAMRSINAASLAYFLSDSRKISFDLVVKTMYETGKDLAKSYRETAEGGLAKLYKK